MAGNARLVVEVVATSATFQADLGRAAAVAQAQAKRIEKSIEGIKTQLASAGRTVAGAIGIPLGVGEALRFLGEIKDKTVEGERSLNQLQAALTATGHAAGLTARDLESLNDSVQLKTVFDDDEIRKAETALLRFRKVQGDVFQDAIKLAPDVAAAIGTDLPSAAQALGRALTDPETGMRALRAAGVNLSEQTKDLAARMTEAGDRAGAMRLVLDEVRKSVGGASEADTKGLAGAIARLNREWGDLQKAAGRRIFGTTGQDADLITEAIERMRKKAAEGETSLLDMILHPIEAARRNTEALRAFFNVFQEGSKRSVSGKITNLGLTPEQEEAADKAREARLKDREEQLYVDQQTALKKRAANSALFYASDLSQQKAFFDQYNAQLEHGYGRGTTTLETFFGEQRSLAEQNFLAIDKGITKQIQDQQAVVSAPSANRDERESARLKILQLVNQADEARSARNLRLLQLTQQEEIAVERLKDSYGELTAKFSEVQGDPARAAEITFEQQNRTLKRILEARLANAPDDASRAEAQRLLDELGKVKAVTIDRAAAEVRHTVNDITAQLLLLRGDTAGATALRLHDSNEEVRRQLTARGDSVSLARLTEVERLAVAQARLNDLQTGYNLAVDELGVIQGRVDLQLQSGVITELDSLNQRAAAAKQYADGLRPVVEAYEAIARASGNTADIVHAQQLRLELEKLEAQADVLRKKFQDIFVESFTENLTALVTGTKNLKTAVHDFEKSVVQSISNIASKNIGEYLFGKEGPLGGLSDLLGGLFGGGKGKGKDATGGAALTAAGTTLQSSGTTLTSAGTLLVDSGTLLNTAASQLIAAASSLQASSLSQSAGPFGQLGLGSFSGAPGLPGADLGGGFFNPFEGLTGFASGGRPPLNRPSIVGEHGPELFVPDSSGTVVPNDLLRRRGGGSSGVTIHAPVTVTIEGAANTRTAKQTGLEVYRAVTRAARSIG